MSRRFIRASSLVTSVLDMGSLKVTVALLLTFSSISYLQGLPLSGNELTLVTAPHRPFVMSAQNSDTNRYEGFAIDMMSELSKLLGFNYKIKMADDGRWGSRNDATGKWDGMIGEVIDGAADIAFGAITMNSQREEDVDFTHPFMNLGVSILHRKDPIVGGPANSMALFYPKTNFSTDVQLTIFKKFDSVEQLLNQRDIKFGLVQSGSTQQFFQNSRDPLYASVWSRVNADARTGLRSGEGSGVNTVKGGGYAFMMESPSIEYEVERDPCLYQIGGNLIDRNFGLVVRKGSQLRDLLSQGIFILSENGKLMDLKKKWWTVDPRVESVPASCDL